MIAKRALTAACLLPLFYLSTSSAAVSKDKNSSPTTLAQKVTVLMERGECGKLWQLLWSNRGKSSSISYRTMSALAYKGELPHLKTKAYPAYFLLALQAARIEKLPVLEITERRFSSEGKFDPKQYGLNFFTKSILSNYLSGKFRGEREKELRKCYIASRSYNGCINTYIKAERIDIDNFERKLGAAIKKDRNQRCYSNSALRYIVE